MAPLAAKLARWAFPEGGRITVALQDQDYLGPLPIAAQLLLSAQERVLAFMYFPESQRDASTPPMFYSVSL